MRSDKTWVAWMRWERADNPSADMRRKATLVLSLKSAQYREAIKKVHRNLMSGRWSTDLAGLYLEAIEVMHVGYRKSAYGDHGGAVAAPDGEAIVRKHQGERWT